MSHTSSKTTISAGGGEGGERGEGGGGVTSASINEYIVAVDFSEDNLSELSSQAIAMKW